jgi:hypothetical protein
MDPKGSKKPVKKTTRVSSSLASIMKSVVGPAPDDKGAKGRGKTVQQTPAGGRTKDQKDTEMKTDDKDHAAQRRNLIEQSKGDAKEKVIWDAEKGKMTTDVDPPTNQEANNETDLKGTLTESYDLMRASESKNGGENTGNNRHKEAESLVDFWQQEVVRLDNELTTMGPSKSPTKNQVADKLSSAQVMLKEALLNLSIVERVDKAKHDKNTTENNKQDKEKRVRWEGHNTEEDEPMVEEIVLGDSEDEDVDMKPAASIKSSTNVMEREEDEVKKRKKRLMVPTD